MYLRRPTTDRFGFHLFTALLLASTLSCDGCPTDAGRVTVEPIDGPLGTMYFCPYWPMHKLSNNCDARTDAPCAYAPLGLPRVKFEDVRWDHIEPRAPSGDQRSYDWSVLDDAVLAWEQAGAQHLQFHLVPTSSWAMRESRPIAEDFFGLSCDEITGGCEDLPTNPAPEHWEDWRAFVTAFCERYDGDGVDDVEGLMYSHLEFELLNEGQNWWFFMGSSEDYGELAEHTREALDACNEDAELVHYGLTFNGLLHDDATDEEYWQRVEEMVERLDPVLYGPGFRHGHDMMLGSPDPDASYDVVGTLSRCELYDAVALHCNMSIEHMIEEYTYLRDKLDGYGCESVEIYCGDSTSGPTLFSPTELEWWDSSYGGADFSGERIHLALGEPYATYGSMCNEEGLSAELSYDEAKAWYDGHHAAFAVKKSSTALALGMSAYMAGLLEQWPPASGCYWMYQGLTESPVEGFGLVPVDFGDPNPVFHSYRLLAEKLIDYESATREVVDDVTIVTFERSGEGASPVYLVWYLDDHLPAPGESELTREFELQVGSASVLVTRLITEAGVEEPSTETVATVDGLFSGTAAQTPFFIEPVSE